MIQVKSQNYKWLQTNSLKTVNKFKFKKPKNSLLNL